MTHAIVAWRDQMGNCGITIGSLTAVGYQNVVAEIDIDESELPGFITQCQAALQRALDAPGPLQEQLPGGYESWPG